MKYSKKYRKVLGLALAALAFNACSDDWDEHYKVQPEAGGASLWQTISTDPTLSNFKLVLEHCGYDKVLASPQVFTVFAPTNDNFTEAQANAQKAIYDEDKQVEDFPLPHVDTMLLISDCSRRGIQAVARIAEMVEQMELKPGKMGLIVNRAPGGVLDDGIKAEIEKHGLTLFGVLPQDEGVYRCDCDGEPSAKLPDSNPVKVALKGIMQDLGL